MYYTKAIKTRLFVLIIFILFNAKAAVWGVDITDALGRKLFFMKPPERVVIAGRSLIAIADAVYMFPEAENKVVAVERVVQGKTGFLSLLDDAVDDTKAIGSGAGVEEIIGTHPDVVLLKSYMRNSLGLSIEILDIPVLYFDFEEPGEYLNEIRTLGTLLGNTARAEKIAAYYEFRTKNIEEKTSHLPDERKPKVLFLSYFDKGGTVTFNVPSVTWLQARMIELAGGIPVWRNGGYSDIPVGNGWTKVGFEQVAVWNPDFIIVTSYFSDIDEVVERLYASHIWQSIPAVREGHLLGFPADFFSWDQPDPRWILGLMWLGRKLHPGLFRGIDIRAEIDTFYRYLYSLNEETIRKKIRPLLRGDID